MQTPEKLLPCKCGWEPNIYDRRGFSIACGSGCGRAVGAKTRDEAIAMWNAAMSSPADLEPKPNENPMSNLPPGVRDSDISKAADAPPILPLREYLDSLDDGQRDEFERVFSEKVMASLIVSVMMSRDPKKIWQEFCDNLNDFAADAQQNHRTFSRRATGPSEAEQRAELYGQMQDLIHRRNLGHAIGFIHTCYTRAVSLSRDGDKESIRHSAEICSIIGRDSVRVTAPTIPGLLPALIADLEKMLSDLWMPLPQPPQAVKEN